MIEKGRENLHVEPADRGAQGRCAAGVGQVHVTGIDRRNECRRAGNKNGLHVDTVLGKKPFSCATHKVVAHRAHRSVANDHLSARLGGGDSGHDGRNH